MFFFYLNIFQRFVGKILLLRWDSDPRGKRLLNQIEAKEAGVYCIVECNASAYNNVSRREIYFLRLLINFFIQLKRAGGERAKHRIWESIYEYMCVL